MAQQRKIGEIAAVRWSVLAIVSFTMLGGYMITDIMSPLKPVLERELGWTSTEYGLFSGAYSWFNVFFLMIIFGGILLDKAGIRFTGMASCLVMLAGGALKYAAIKGLIPVDGYLFGINRQVLLASVGFAIFGVGCETVNITATKIAVKWFKGKELALALGLQVAAARLGTMLALAFSLPVAEHFGVSDDAAESFPLLMALFILCIGTMGFFLYTFYDRMIDSENAGGGDAASDVFKYSDVFHLLRNSGFWIITALCVFFYTAVFPFLKYAPDLMINKYGVEESLAGFIPALLPVGTLIMTPLFGSLYDRRGHGAEIMIVGALILTAVHVFFALPILNTWWFAMLLMVLLGVAVSLLPSAMWPSVPKIVAEKDLGTAYAFIFWIQNWGLMGGPLLIGWLLNRYCVAGKSGDTVLYDYTLPMEVFAATGVAALLLAFVLRYANKKKRYGLEQPNIRRR